MLDAVLRLAASGKARTIDEIARGLSTSPVMVEQMFSELVRRGYLVAASSDCHALCEGCASAAACRFKREPRLWTLTAKGERAIGGESKAVD